MIMHKSELVIFGASNIVSDIVECAIACQIQPKKIVLDLPEVTDNRSFPIAQRIERLNSHWNLSITTESLASFIPTEHEIYLLGPTTPLREELVERIRVRHSLSFHTLIHPTAYVSSMTKLGQGVFIGAKSVIAPGVILNDHVFINRGVTIGHDTKVGSYTRLQPGTNIGGLTQIGKSVTVGIGATIVDRIVIGDHAVIAAGSCVIHDIESHKLVAGSPAMIKRSI